jgi:hypothetical protein
VTENPWYDLRDKEVVRVTNLDILRKVRPDDLTADDITARAIGLGLPVVGYMVQYATLEAVRQQRVEEVLKLRHLAKTPEVAS